MADSNLLAIRGQRSKGESVRSQNVTAALAVANLVRTSLGPKGLDKMLVDDIGDVTISNDGATILKKLDIEHPAGKVLVDMAILQDEEVGDGTTTVVLLAAELLKKAMDLIQQNLHATTIISGYRLAQKKVSKHIKGTLSKEMSELSRESLLNIAKTSLSSKIIGRESELFAGLCVDAILSVSTVSKRGRKRANAKNVQVLKAPGQGSASSFLVKGFALNCVRGSQQMPLKVEKAKIALIDFDLRRTKMDMGIHVLVDDPKKLEAIRQKEIDIVKDRVEKIIKAGANVILSTRGMDDIAMKFMSEKGVMGVRRALKLDLKRIAKAIGGTIVLNMTSMDGEEAFDKSSLGEAESVSEESIGDNNLIFVNECKKVKVSSILLRGPHSYMLEEMERSLEDALNVLARTIESHRIVPGGGCVETSASINLELFATSIGTKEQLAIAQFAEALLVIPKTLAANASLDSNDLVSKLRAIHNEAQTSDGSKDELHKYGLDLENGTLQDNVRAGIIEPTMSKIKSIQFATECAITLLRIDETIDLDKEPEQERPPRGY